MDKYYLSLGANLGDRAATITKAMAALAHTPEITLEAVSSLYETPPWGKTDQPAFLNAAAAITTSLSPRELLVACQTIETSLGRVRHEKWGSRVIDIDLVYSPDQHLATADLQLPHPYLTERAFVLVPLAEIAPDLSLEGRPVTSYLAAVRADIEKIIKVSTLTIPEVR